MRDRDQPMNTARHDVRLRHWMLARLSGTFFTGFGSCSFTAWEICMPFVNFNSRSRHRCFQFGLVHATTMPVVTIARNIWAADA